MKKKIHVIIVAVSIVLFMVACSGKEQMPREQAVVNAVQTEQLEEEVKNETILESEKTEYDNSTPEAIIAGIQSDYELVIQNICEEYEKIYTEIGEDYNNYVDNKELLTKWYEKTLLETAALFEGTRNYAKEYFLLVAQDVAPDDDAIDDAMDDFYDEIYDNVLDDFYNEIYDGVLDDAYDDFYDGIIKKGYDIVPYDEWSKVSSDSYDEWNESSSEIYDMWDDIRSDLYDMWSDVSGEFYNNNFNIEVLFTETDLTDTEYGEILAAIQNDFENTIILISEELIKVYDVLGTSYDSYVKNAEVLEKWYELVSDEAELLYERAESHMKSYYEKVAKDLTGDKKAIEKAIDNAYDAVYEDAYDSFYEKVYENIFDEISDKYYDGVFNAEKDNVKYADWLDTRSDFYSDWLDARSDVYGDWLDAHSDLYGDWLDIKGEFWSGNYNVEDILGQTVLEEKDVLIPKESLESIAAEPEEEKNTLEKGIRPEFKEVMDGYEAFFDEYVEFMKKYMNADATTMLGLMSDYAEYMTQYTETMSKLSELEDGEMTTEEALYFMEVYSRITAKLLEVTQ